MYLGEVHPFSFHNMNCTEGAVPTWQMTIGVGIGAAATLFTKNKKKQIAYLALGLAGGYAFALGTSLYYQKSGKC